MSKLDDLLFGLSSIYILGNILYIGYYGIYIGDAQLGVIGSMNGWVYAGLLGLTAVVFLITWLHDAYERGY